jgi:hypothetical protein
MRWRRLTWTLVPPVAACALARWLVVAVSTGPRFFDVDPIWWARWDSGNYASIATEGYYSGSCLARGTPELGDLCANTTWYPGYPYLGKVATWLGLPFGASAVFISVACWVATVVLVWVWFLRDQPRVRALASLAIAAFFPGVVYQQALFPISILALLTVLTIRLGLTRKWWWAAVAAGTAGFVYPIGVVLVPAMVVWVLLVRVDLAARARILTAAAVGLIASCGTLAVFVIQQIEIGDWHASISMQRRLGTRLLNPVESFLTVVLHRDSLLQAGDVQLKTPMAAQTLLVAVIVLAISACVALAWRRAHEVNRDDVALLVMFWGIWLLPLASFIDTGLYRREATLLPIVALAPRLPAWVSVPLAVASVWVAALISPHFFDYLLN